MCFYRVLETRTGGSLVEREMLWENVFSIPFREHRDEKRRKRKTNLLTFIIQM